MAGQEDLLDPLKERLPPLIEIGGTTESEVPGEVVLIKHKDLTMF